MPPALRPRRSGTPSLTAESVIVTHLTETIRANAADMLTRQDTRQLLDQLKETNAAVVEEVIPDVLSLGEVQRVLQALLKEGVSIRDLGTIVESVGDKARVTRDPALLSEYARQALGRAITAPHLDAERKLRAIALDPAVEQEVSDSIAQTADGEYLVMEPSRAQALVSDLKAQVENALAHGSRPVLLCSARVRRHLRRLCEQAHAPAARLLLQRDRARHPSRDRGGGRVSQGPTRMFRGTSIEEILPRIRAELGPDAVITRQREGLKGGFAGFFAEEVRRDRSPRRSPGDRPDRRLGCTSGVC